MQELRSLQEEFQQGNELNIEEEESEEELKEKGKKEEEVIEDKDVNVEVKIEIKESELSPLRRDDSMDELEALVNSMPNAPREEPERSTPVVSPERVLELDFA